MMDNTITYVMIVVLGLVASVLFITQFSKPSLTEEKQVEVKRKRAALSAKRKAQADAVDNALPFE